VGDNQHLSITGRTLVQSDQIPVPAALASETLFDELEVKSSEGFRNSVRSGFHAGMPFKRIPWFNELFEVCPYPAFRDRFYDLPE
jgi:hypothetical protein